MKPLKYIIGVFMLLFLSTITFAQNKKDNSYDKTIDKVSNATETVYNDLKSTAPKISNALNSLGKELKVGVNKVWDILVRQQLVWSIVYTILTISALFNWYMFYSRNFKKPKKEELVLGKEQYISIVDNPEFNKDYYNKYCNETGSYYNDHKKDPRYIKYITKILEKDCLIAPPLISNNKPWFTNVHFIICVTLSVFSFYHFSDMVTGYINPEFGALKTIAEVASKIK